MDFEHHTSTDLSEYDYWNDLPIALKEGINKAKAELDRGEGIPHDDIMAEARSRFLLI